MFMETDEELLNYFVKTRQLQKNTAASYAIFTKQYAELNNMTMVELLEEAEKEEESGARWKHRTLRKRLLNYRTFLYENYAASTAKSRLGKIQSFYRHFEIEIHPLPPISNVNIKKSHMGFQDLPDTMIIKKAMKIASPLMRAIISFMSSSGSAAAETKNLTVQSLINATNNEYVSYHDSTDIYEIINQLKNRDDIVPVFEMKRQKTNKFYYAFCSPEAVTETINYLASTTKKLTPESPLFEISDKQFTVQFQKINDSLGLGKLENGRRRFASHMLRKFHATSLYNDKVPLEIIDTLQGRGKDQVHSAYFMEDPMKLREIYIEHLNCLTINLDVNNLDLKSPEYVKLENENTSLKSELNKLDDIMERLNKLESMSDDDLLNS